MSEKYQYFNGLKFTRDDKTGYYLNSTIRKRMHRYVWEFYHGEIPEGYHIHHIDGDKSNNDISNLEMIHGEKHQSGHSKKWHEQHPGVGKENLDKAREFANEWHRSEEGRKWHSAHSKVLRVGKRAMVCDMCGKEFEAVYNGANRFCSNVCKSKWRRRSGIDNISRKCLFCGKEFVSNKYDKQIYCSRGCKNKGVKRAKEEGSLLC